MRGIILDSLQVILFITLLHLYYIDVKKKQSRIDGLDGKIISLYAKGMSISDIKIQLAYQ